MAWYYHLNGENHGPIEATELQNLQQGNIIALDTPVWTEGMPQWEPFQTSKAALSHSTAPGTATVATQPCAECGKVFPEEEMLHYENSWVCATCKPLFFQRIKEGVTPVGTFAFATIGKRFVAIFVDGIVILICVFLPIILIFGIAGAARKNTSPLFSALIILFQYGVPALYEIFFIGKFGATPGKMLMKIKVIMPDGGPISYARATGRHFAKYLSGIILYIGYLMAFWDEEKRALHDRICNTRVVDNPS